MHIVKSIDIVSRIGGFSFCEFLVNKLIEIVEHPRTDLNSEAFLLRSALDVTSEATFNALDTLHNILVLSGRLFQTPILLMTNMSAPRTLNDIDLRAIPSLMTALVTLEADFLCAFEGVVSVLTAEDAGGLESVVGAVLLLMPNLFTIMTLDRRIVLCPVPLSFLLLHIVKGVIFIVFVIGLLPIEVVE